MVEEISKYQKYKESMKKYREKNKEKLNKMSLEHYYKNRDKYLEQRKKIREEIRFGGLRETILKRDGYRCVKCGITREEHKKKFGRDIAIDHIDGNGRSSKNPNNSPDNLQTLCSSCHSKKDNKETKFPFQKRGIGNRKKQGVQENEI